MVQKMGVRVTLLVEDEAIERFSREVLLNLGFHRRELYVEPYPVGQGSAKQWVTRLYPEVVRVFRSKVNSQNVSVLVGTEADELTVLQRRAELESALQSANLDSRGPAEEIVLWIPRWNVETWLLSLSGGTVDEDDEDCKKRVKRPDFVAIASEFVRQFRIHKRNEQQVTLPSLIAAYTETLRLPVS